MEIFKSLGEFRAWRDRLAEHEIKSGARLKMGFVPTMGALHEGHASLLRQSASDNEITILSIYVNPTQFNRPDDLAKYPRTTGQDLEIAHRCGVDAVLIPTASEDLYPDQYTFQIVEKEFSKILEGEHRPGHFEGMLTVVLKLLNVARASKAYFGEKDFQQLALVRGMAKAFFLQTEIVGCPTIRESDGLAMSSRNLRLSKSDRLIAPKLFSAMTEFSNLADARKVLEEIGFKVDYLVDHTHEGSTRRLVAASLGEVRLIDNVPVKGFNEGAAP